MQNATKTTKLNVKPAVQKVLGVLSERNADMLASRYGIARLGVSQEGRRETLESIGRRYAITRERVRQIEEASYNKIRNAEVFGLLTLAMNEVEAFLRAQGGVATEEQLMGLVPESQQPYMGLLLALSPFVKIKENDSLAVGWAVDNEHAEGAVTLLTEVEKSVHQAKRPLDREEVLQLALTLNNERLPLSQESATALLALSKTVQEGPFGKWGIAHWPEISPRGVRDKAYLIFERENQPLHFRDIAQLIDTAPFVAGNKRNTHPQTVHNELIKDNRFVLVGRGIYALSKWGYTPGTVKDVIVEVLKQEGKPLGKDDIISRVLEQRMVQKNTILLNLQNRGHFQKTEEGHFYLT